jgi:hypothetical protein
VAKNNERRRLRTRARALQGGVLVASVAVAAAAVAPAAGAREVHALGASSGRLVPNSLVISGTEFPAKGVNIVAGQTQLPYASNLANDTTDSLTPIPLSQDTLTTAIAGGQYPYVFNNDTVDGNFGVTTSINLWDVTGTGHLLGTVHVPTSDVTTSFSSKSELALNVATNGKSLSFSAYAAPAGDIDVSNSSTPGTPDPTNTDVSGLNAAGQGGYYRVEADVNGDGRWTFTETNSYSGNNGRAAILNSADGQYITAGNAGNGNFPVKNEDVTTDAIGQGIVNGTGAQQFPESFLPESAQNPTPGSSQIPLGGFDQFSTLKPYASPGTLPYGTLIAGDKPGKDTNFRGLSIYNNVVYLSKGSGSNGINTVYFVDTTGTACSASNPDGLPVAGAPLPSPSTTYQVCILNGFETQSAKSPTWNDGFPFGLWFANPTTLYVADEGNGGDTYDATTNTWTDAVSTPSSTTNPYPAGLQKWVLENGTWTLVYTIQNGLGLGQPYTVPGYPTGTNTVTSLPWAPATDGLRNITGHVNGNGTVTIWATTSTVSGNGDQGADPNKVVSVTDRLGATTIGDQKFSTIAPARYAVRYGGVTLLPNGF